MRVHNSSQLARSTRLANKEPSLGFSVETKRNLQYITKILALPAKLTAR